MRVVWSLGRRAARWLYPDPTEHDRDGMSLLWRMHQGADEAHLPSTRTVVQVVLTGVGGAEGWLDIDRDGRTVCKDDQGEDVDLAVLGDTGHQYKWLSGIAPFRELVGSGRELP